MSRKIFMFLLLVSSVFCAQAARVEQKELVGVTSLIRAFHSDKETYLIDEGSSRSYMVRYFFHNGSYDVIALHGSLDSAAVCSPEALFHACEEFYNKNSGSINVNAILIT